MGEQITKKLSVLIVDDVELNREVLSIGLIDNYNVLHASNGREAIDIIESNNNEISLILLDLFMPIMDGYEFLEYKKNKQSFEKIPVIVISSDDSHEHIERALEIGALDYISKSLNPRIVRKRVNNSLAIFARHRQLLDLMSIENKKLEKSYDRLKYFDEDTDGYNFDGFVDHAKSILSEDKNLNSKYIVWFYRVRNFSMLINYCDNDEIKALLRHLADVIARDLDVCTDVSGHMIDDMFVSLIKFRGENAIHDHFEKVSNSVSNFLITRGKNYIVDIYAGFYRFQNSAMNSVNIMRAIDHARETEKLIDSSRGSKFKEFDPSLFESRFKSEIICQMLDTSMAKGHIKVFYQPQYNYMSGQIIGFEALCRWQHPQLGFISPGEFIPALEESGQIVQLDFFVWEESCKFLDKLGKDGGYGVNYSVSLNISRYDILVENMADYIESLANKYNISPKRIHLEISVETYVSNPKVLKESIAKFHKIGFMVTMVDFENGTKTLEMLKDVPVDNVKLNLLVLRNFEKEKKAKNVVDKGFIVVKSLVEMIRALNIEVIAEGVETENQVNFLNSLGVNLMQGYYFNKPMSVDDIYSVLYSEGVKLVQRKRKIIGLQKQYTDSLVIKSGMKYMRDIKFFEFVLDSQGYVVCADNKFSEVCGYTLTELKENKISVFDLIPNSDIGAVVDYLKKNDAKQNVNGRFDGVVLFYHRLNTKDGKLLSVCTFRYKKYSHAIDEEQYIFCTALAKDVMRALDYVA